MVNYMRGVFAGTILTPGPYVWHPFSNVFTAKSSVNLLYSSAGRQQRESK